VKLRLITLIPSLVVLLANGVFLAVGQEVCTGFSSESVGNQYIERQFSPAVVRIQDVGTAYLIDSERGYLLTAGHVLDDLAANNEAQEVVLGQSPYSHLGFVIIKRPPNVDIALLQLTKADALKNIRPLDIAFESPDFDASLFVMGYPQYGQQKRIILRSGSVKVSAYPPSGLIEITHTTAGGNSGGPLIDNFGFGRYLPLTAFEDVLDQIPVSDRMHHIEQGLTGGTITVEDLKQLLRESNSKSPTNLELYTWTHNLSLPSSLRVLKKYFRCPIMPALVERHIPDAILPFVAGLESDQVGEVKLVLARREYKQGHNGTAAQLARESIEALSQSPASASSLREEAKLLGWAIDLQRKLGNAEIVRQDAVPVVVTLDTGAVEKYLVHWVGTVDSTKIQVVQTGGPDDAGQFCRWHITSGISRQVYYIDSKGQVLTDNAVSKADPGIPGSDFVINQSRPENCLFASPRYEADVSAAHSAIANQFPKVIVRDLEQIENEFRARPHVANVAINPLDQQYP
jgi:hypothetical protein